MIPAALRSHKFAEPGRHRRRDLSPRIPRLMRKPATQRGAFTPRRQRSSGCRRQGEARPLPTRLQRAQFIISITTNTTTTSAVFFLPAVTGIQTTPRLVLLLQSRRHRPRVRPGHCNENRHRPTQAPSQKAPRVTTTSPTLTTFTFLHTPTSTIRNTRHLDDSDDDVFYLFLQKQKLIVVSERTNKRHHHH
jgi:hypothetical protein